MTLVQCRNGTDVAFAVELEWVPAGSFWATMVPLGGRTQPQVHATPEGLLLKPAAQVAVRVEYTRGTQGIPAEAGSAEAEWLVEQHSYSMDALEPSAPGQLTPAPADAMGERRVRVVDRGRLIAHFSNGTQQVIPILVLEA